MLNKKEIPNFLTYGRAAAVLALFVLVFYAPHWQMLMFWIFAVAAATDFLDGYLARKWKVESDYGALLDPIVDKLLVVLMLLYILKLDRTWIIILPISIIILRELYVSGLREYLGSKKLSLPVSMGGKWKTAAQMIAIGCIIGGAAFQVKEAWMFGRVMLIVAAILALITAVDYTVKTFQKLK